MLANSIIVKKCCEIFCVCSSIVFLFFVLLLKNITFTSFSQQILGVKLLFVLI